ncbi:MAG: pentapeptide repeat-containing protein [Roseiarcus sp.]
MNDDAKLQLQAADDNPWYCLATVHGEQNEKLEDHFPSLDEKNRVTWNRWMAAGMSAEQRAVFLKEGFDAFELVPFSEQERAEFLVAFAKRTNAEPPNPKDKIDFHGVRFQRPFFFSVLIFLTDALFDGAIFVSKAFFLKTAFSGSASFNKTAFSDSALFSDATFKRSASFGDAAISSASFYKARFSGDAFFSNATFTSGAIFSGAVFSRSAFFMGVTFPPVTRFTDVAFCSTAYFHNATFGIEANFSKARFATDAFFKRAVFAGTADFTSCEFKSLIDFSGAKFESRVPIFFDSKLREAILWGQSTWPPPPKDTGAAQLQAVAYERLKSEMERLKRHREEQYFFAKELRALRELEPPYSPLRALDFAYDYFGGYGQSVGRPMFWLGALFAAGAGFFALTPTNKGSPLSFNDAAGFSATNLISLLPFRPDRELIEHLSTSAKIFGDIQSILGGVLLFLLAVALRNRFRTK